MGVRLRVRHQPLGRARGTMGQTVLPELFDASFPPRCSAVDPALIVLTRRRSGTAGAERWSGSAAAAWRGGLAAPSRLFRRKCGSGGEQDPAAEKVEAAAPEGLAFQHFQLAHLSLRLPAAPYGGER